jgi:hypothetical protein
MRRMSKSGDLSYRIITARPLDRFAESAVKSETLSFLENMLIVPLL